MSDYKLPNHNHWLEFTEEVKKKESGAVPGAGHNWQVRKDIVLIQPFIEHLHPATAEPHARQWYQHLANEPGSEVLKGIQAGLPSQKLAEPFQPVKFMVTSIQGKACPSSISLRPPHSAGSNPRDSRQISLLSMQR